MKGGIVLSTPSIPTPATKWTRMGPGAQAAGPVLTAMSGGGESGKTRLAACACRAVPAVFGQRAVYLAIDPESASLSSVLPEDVNSLEVCTITAKHDLFEQIRGIYRYNWRAEGINTIITDTMTVASQLILAQVTDSGKFSDKHIELSGGVKVPMQGDFGAAQSLVMALLREQLNSGMNHLTLFHDLEVRPDADKPGEPIGGPATIGKGQVRSIVNWYNTMLHLVKRPIRRTTPGQPLQYERVVHTTSHGIWQAKLRVRDLENTIPEIIMKSDPINVWQTLYPSKQELK